MSVSRQVWARGSTTPVQRLAICEVREVAHTEASRRKTPENPQLTAVGGDRTDARRSALLMVPWKHRRRPTSLLVVHPA